MRIAIFGNTFQLHKSPQAKRLFEALQRVDAEVLICDDFYRFLIEKTELHPAHQELITSDDFDADIALSIGGDGTFLKTAQRVGDKNIPILGINTGRLGFLADVSNNDIETAVTEIFKNYYRVEERSLLYIESTPESKFDWPYALNEIAIQKKDSSAMISVHTFLDDNFLNTYQADGLIIATPSGSTAYSLSVGGPIIEPQAENFVLTPIAPHSLNVRPLVISDDKEIKLIVESRSKSYLASLDGRSFDMDSQFKLSIKKAPFTTKVVKRHQHLFYDTLRTKLMWGADKRV